jgi:hypothetical protein
MKTKNLVKKSLRKQRKAFCWLKRKGHTCFRQDSKTKRKQLNKFYEQLNKFYEQYSTIIDN